jgi:hypothetical protein
MREPTPKVREKKYKDERKTKDEISEAKSEATIGDAAADFDSWI